MMIDDELEEIWDKAVMALCKIFSQNLYSVTEENHYKPHHDSRCPTRNLNQAPPAKKEESLPLQLICLINNSKSCPCNRPWRPIWL
jgi:hypothetical protein